MAFDPIQEDCHRLVLEALRRDNIPLTDGAAVERLMEQFTRNPAPLIVHDRDRELLQHPWHTRLRRQRMLLERLREPRVLLLLHHELGRVLRRRSLDER